jgi:predicted HTH transcriptional regulator
LSAIDPADGALLVRGFGGGRFSLFSSLPASPASSPGLTGRCVEAFLAEAGDETLLWEAKGGAVKPNAASVRKAVCGFANSRGGFLILGADGSVQTGRSLVGLPFPEEPGVWLDSVIRDGLRPVPSFEVRAWQISDDRAAAVVMVEPTPLPP